MTSIWLRVQTKDGQFRDLESRAVGINRDGAPPILDFLSEIAESSDGGERENTASDTRRPELCRG